MPTVHERLNAIEDRLETIEDEWLIIIKHDLDNIEEHLKNLEDDDLTIIQTQLKDLHEVVGRLERLIEQDVMRPVVRTKFDGLKNDELLKMMEKLDEKIG